MTLIHFLEHFGVAVILIMRLLAIRWEWRLPEFSTKHDADGS